MILSSIDKMPWLGNRASCGTELGKDENKQQESKAETVRQPVPVNNPSPLYLRPFLVRSKRGLWG